MQIISIPIQKTQFWDTLVTPYPFFGGFFKIGEFQNGPQKLKLNSARGEKLPELS